MNIIRVASLAAICAVTFVESAYAGAVPAAPAPIAGAGIPGLLIAVGVAAYAWYRRQK